MKQSPYYNKYWPLIQHKWWPSKDWIVWNWLTAKWDTIEQEIVR